MLLQEGYIKGRAYYVSSCSRRESVQVPCNNVGEVPLSLLNLFSITGTMSATVVVIAMQKSYPRRTFGSV